MSTTGVATIAEVAHAAGVSRATVSRVMNGRSTVDPEMAARVRKAARELNYSPSTVARSLSLGRTQTVALLVPDLGNPMFQQVLRGANQAATRAGYRILVADSIEEPEREAELAIEARRRCDALILCSPRMPEAQLSEVLTATSPVVLVNREPHGNDVPALAVDYAGGIRTLAEHLIGLGHQRFIYLAGPETSASNTARLEGLALLQAAHPEISIQHSPCGSMIEDGYAALEAVLNSQATAVLAFNDLVAFGLLGKLNETGVGVPRGISVAGFDDIAFAKYATPSLTTMSVPQMDLGRHAWEQLHQLLVGEAESTSLFFRPRLIERVSTGPAPVLPTTAPAAPERGSLPLWSRDDDAGVLRAGGSALARYERHPAMPDVHAPRPYLHPVHTWNGAPLTEISPLDHRHQYGVSFAVAQVNGSSFWGGRTYVRDAGPTLLQIHGTQVSHDMTLVGPALTEQLTWYGHDGAELLTERRRLVARTLPDQNGWELTWQSLLHAGTGEVTIDSPATQGRTGAGYGGIFWRFPDDGEAAITCADGTGEEVANGSTSPWLLLSRAGERPWTALLLQEGEVRPWFVRSTDYLGAGPALAWSQSLHIPAGDTLEVGLRAVLLDGVVAADQIADLIESTTE